MKKKKMNEGDSPNQIIFIKYKEEKNIKKVLIVMKNRGETNIYM